MALRLKKVQMVLMTCGWYAENLQCYQHRIAVAENTDIQSQERAQIIERGRIL
jgi:hypothetical protein